VFVPTALSLPPKPILGHRFLLKSPGFKSPLQITRPFSVVCCDTQGVHATEFPLRGTLGSFLSPLESILTKKRAAIFFRTNTYEKTGVGVATPFLCPNGFVNFAGPPKNDQVGYVSRGTCLLRPRSHSKSHRPRLRLRKILDAPFVNFWSSVSPARNLPTTPLILLLRDSVPLFTMGVYSGSREANSCNSPHRGF
jgi:hypothetical protein